MVFHQAFSISGVNENNSSSATPKRIVCGGYTSEPWDQSTRWKRCDKSWLFKLTAASRGTQQQQQPLYQKVLVSSVNYAMYCTSSYGLFFGGCDLRVNHNRLMCFPKAYPELGLPRTSRIDELEIYAVTAKGL